MLLGIYKSFEELEENLTIDEMVLMLKADREKEERNFKFFAALNGAKWDDEDGGGEDAEDVVERMKRKVAAKVGGKTDEQAELEALGIKFN